MNTLLFLGNMSGWEIFAVLLIVILLFGGKKIPELMRGIGRGVREFNDAKSNLKNEFDKGMNEKNNSTGENNS